MFKRYVFVKGLTSLVDSDGKYYINIFGKVMNYWGEEIPVLKDSDGHNTVKASSWDGERIYRVIDLVAIQFKDIHVPKQNYNDVVAFPMDGNKQNLHAENVGYRFKKKIESLDQKGFYHVPGYTKFAISEDGKLYNTVKQKFVDWYITKPNPDRNIKGGYKTYKYYMEGNSYEMPRHRAMLLTFCDYPDNCDKLIVNHKNGIPGHDDLSNLEWMTRGENNKHAYVTDLKSQHHRVLCRDVLTGEVMEYYSVSECSRKLGYATDETIRYRLVKCGFCQVFGDGKQFKYKDDLRDWVLPDNPAQAIEDAKEAIEIVGRNCCTMEETVFESMTDAYRRTGANDATIAYRLNKDDRSPLMGYQFKKLSDIRPLPSFTEEEYKSSLIPSAFKVDCRNLLTGETREYSSVNTAAKGIGNLNIPYVLRRGDQPLLSDGWQLKFENQEWEDVQDFEETLYKLRKEVMARCEKTGKVIIAESAKRMAEELGLEPKALRLAAFTRGNKVYHNYRFRLGITEEPWPTNNGIGNSVMLVS